jgi:hypothetical protein
VTGSNGEEAIVAKDEDEGETTATTAVRGTSEGTIVTSTEDTCYDESKQILTTSLVKN